MLLTSSCTGSSSESDRPVIRIAYLPITHSIPILVQNELQRHTERGYTIELVRFNSWPELVDALRQNRVDGASMLFETALTLNQASGDMRLVSLSHRSGNVVVASDYIQSFSDLKGRTIAIPHRLSPHNTWLHIILEQNNMSIDDITVIELAPAEMPSSLVAGAVSAFIVAEPYGSISAASGLGNILFTSDDFDGHDICCGLVFNNEFLSNNVSIMNEFLENFQNAAEISHKRDEFVVQTYRNHINIRENVIGYSLEHISFINLMLSEEEFMYHTNLILRHGVLDSVPSFSEFVHIQP